jgi:hypothetical protein
MNIDDLLGCLFVGLLITVALIIIAIAAILIL